MVTARFKISEIKLTEYSANITMSPVYSSDKSDPNYSWSQATPCGKIEMTVTNKEASKQFEIGKTYHITFSPLE